MVSQALLSVWDPRALSRSADRRFWVQENDCVKHEHAFRNVPDPHEVVGCNQDNRSMVHDELHFLLLGTQQWASVSVGNKISMYIGQGLLLTAQVTKDCLITSDCSRHRGTTRS
jgi:hypothetical protein